MTTSFASLLAALVGADVRFAVAGGVACVLHGHVRATEDIDVLIDPDPANVARLLHVLGCWGEGWARELTVADFPVEPGAVRIIEEFALDVFTEMSGLTWSTAHDHVLWWQSGDLRVPHLDLATLVATKQHSLRPKDQEDVRVLQALAAAART